jgi:hypothetical protein
MTFETIAANKHRCTQMAVIHISVYLRASVVYNGVEDFYIGKKWVLL